MKQISSRVLRIIESTPRPERRLEQHTTYPHSASHAHFVRLYDTIEAPDGTLIPGNLEVIVDQLERDDIPSPDEEYRDVLLREYRDALSRGETLYMFVLHDYVYTDEFEDEMDPSKPEYVSLTKVPAGWLSIEDVCRIRDIDKSTVTRAIYGRELTCGLSSVDGRRYIKDDDLFKTWIPERKRSYLRDRRLLIIFETLLNKHVYTLDELYAEVERVEIERFGDNHLPDEGLDAFMQTVVPSCPRSLLSWRARIEEICIEFGLNDTKKLHRGLGELRRAS